MADGRRASHRASRGCGTRDRGMVVGGSLCVCVCVCTCVRACAQVYILSMKEKKRGFNKDSGCTYA